MRKATGIVRRIDHLGRLVLPKSTRKRMNVDSGQDVEIYVEGEFIVLTHHVPSCVFCGSDQKVHEFKGKSLCESCMIGLSNK